MSVPKSKRTEGKLIVQTKAYGFASYTHQICSNEKVFLKRNRWCSTSKLVSVADDIAIAVDMANSVNVRNGNQACLGKRIEFQTKAIEKTIEMECLMEIAYRDNNREGRVLSDERIDYWIGSLLELRGLIRKWRESTKG